MEGHRLIFGDCMDTIKTMPDNCVDLVLTDIPYGEVNRRHGGLRSLDKGGADVVTFRLADLAGELCRVARGSIYIFCGIGQVSPLRDALKECGFSTRLLIWEKTNPFPMNADKIWLSSVECCVFGKLPRATFNGRYESVVLRYPCGSSKRHPTEKPLPLFERLVAVSSKAGDLVFDPFMGSGTAGVAALKLGRRFMGCELDAGYYRIAEERINEVADQGLLFDNNL